MRLNKRQIIKIKLIILTLLLIGCRQEEKPEKFVAKVNNSILTEESLENYLSDKKFEKKFKNEFIREWIDEEMLYQEAINSGLTGKNEFLNLLKVAEKQIANSIFLKKFYKNYKENISEASLKEYYDQNLENFRVSDKGYFLNIAEFSNEEQTFFFRNELLKNDWNTLANLLNNNPTVLKVSENKFYYNYELSPLHVQRAIKLLKPGEVSIVIRKEPGVFAVVQMIDIVEKNNVPDYKYLKAHVKEVYFVYKRKELYRELIENLYKKYQVEIRKVDE